MTNRNHDQASPGTVRLRPLTLDDVETLAAWGLDDEFCAAAEASIGKPLAYHREWWTSFITSPHDDLIRLAVVIDPDEVVGYADLFGTDPARRELGFAIGARHRWGQGLGRAAAARMLDHGFGGLRLRTIDAEAWDTNPRSIRILQRLGMRETGRGKTGVYQGEPSVYRQFEITAREWATARVHDDAHS